MRLGQGFRKYGREHQLKLMYATKNPGKLRHMKNMLQGLDIKVVGLDDTPLAHFHVDETGFDPLENARIKALAYFRAFGEPVFSCDSGLYIEGLSPDLQPGVHVRRVHGKNLDDEQMLEYYSKLAAGLGGKAKARYRNAICLVVDDQTIYQHDGDDIALEEFYLTSKPHPRKTPGFPLNSLSVDCKTGKYCFDLKTEKNDTGSKTAQTSGFRSFFERTVLSESRSGASPTPELLMMTMEVLT